MKIINHILLLSLVLVMSCDDKVKNYSVIGTWDVYSKLPDETTWGEKDNTWEFNTDGSVLVFTDSNTLKVYYYFCKSENILRYSDQPIGDERCDCENQTNPPQSIIPFEVTFDGSDTMYWEVCIDNGDISEIIKFEKR